MVTRAMELTRILDENENNRITQLRAHPVLKNLEKLGNQQFEQLLVQRAQLSYEFTKLYDCALRGVTDVRLERALEWLVREEYPTNALNHRKALVLDLCSLGLTKHQIMQAEPSEDTTKAIRGLYKLVAFTEQDTNESYDVRVAAALRLGLEVSSGEEFELFLKELCTPVRHYKFTSENSMFYRDHAHHDKKREPIGDQLDKVSGTEGYHPRALSTSLTKLVKDNETLKIAIEAMDRVCAIKMAFYDQFLSFLEGHNGIQA